METSIYLAKVLGIFFVISTAAIISRYDRAMTFEEEAARNPLFTYISGFVILIFGAMLVVSHSVWVLDWRLVITILGWMVLIKGIGRIFFPDAVRRMIEKKRTNRKFILGEAAVLLAGLYLMYYGFIVY